MQNQREVLAVIGFFLLWPTIVWQTASQHTSRLTFFKDQFYVSGTAPNHNSHENPFIPLLVLICILETFTAWQLCLVCKLQGKPHNMMLFNEAWVVLKSNSLSYNLC